MSLLLLTMAAAISAAAPDAEYQQCIDSVTTYADHDYADCTNHRIQLADERLNAQWQDLMGILGRDSETGQALLAEQRAWLGYRDAACLHYLDSQAGTAERFLFYPSCRLELIEARIRQLELLVQDYRFREGG